MTPSPTERKTRGRKSSNRRKRPRGSPQARAAARLAAVQALYQMDIAETPIADALAQYLSGPIPLDDAGKRLGDIDPDFFADLLRGVEGHRAELDAMIQGALSPEWPFERLEALHRALLRAALYELWRRADVPARVAMNEYVDLAHAFYAGPEPAMINALLETLAKRLREAEFDGGAG
ncbi:MAG: transcription antitermination factor NusB [Rhodospirillales bacterium]|nr:transcription antitermination factor NusB [Rhodospirillales bacterium]